MNGDYSLLEVHGKCEFLCVAPRPDAPHVHHDRPLVHETEAQHRGRQLHQCWDRLTQRAVDLLTIPPEAGGVEFEVDTNPSPVFALNKAPVPGPGVGGVGWRVKTDQREAIPSPLLVLEDFDSLYRDRLVERAPYIPCFNVAWDVPESNCKVGIVLPVHRGWSRDYLSSLDSSGRATGAVHGAGPLLRTVSW